VESSGTPTLDNRSVMMVFLHSFRQFLVSGEICEIAGGTAPAVFSMYDTVSCHRCLAPYGAILGAT
jgi:hypothetical protein